MAALPSTSAQGLVIPFGRTEGGFDWVYELEGNRTHVFGVGQTAVPQQRIAVEGADVNLSAGAVVDISGGGDYIATEFVPGVGGSRDVLSAQLNPDTYVILPERQLPYAPHDVLEYSGSALQPGDSIYLAGGAGVEAGTYALLPARYAFLPGAVLVTRVAGYGDLPAGANLEQPSGANIIAGYRTFAGALGERGTEGFAVRPASDVLRDAQYTVTSGNQFFAQQAADAGAGAPRLARDSGVLSLAATATLRLDGALRATAAAGARGGAVDISSERLRVVASASDADDGYVNVSAQSLNQLGAESVLLGGSRAATDEGLRLDVSASVVEVDRDAPLSLREVMLAARDTVTVEQGAAVVADGARVNGEAETLLLEGDGALLRASIGPQVEIRRTPGAGSSGVLDIEAGARLSSTHSLALDASADSRSRGELDVAGGSLNLGASRIALGDAPAASEGLVLASADLSRLNLDELVLTSRSTVDVHGAAALDVNRLVIASRGIAGYGEGAARISAAGSVELGNGANVGEQASGSGVGSLQLVGEQILLTDGAFDLSGFGSVELRAGAAVIADGAALTSAGPLTLTAPQITSATGATSQITSAEQLVIAAASGELDPQLSGVGGRLTLSGRSVEHRGRIELASGVLGLHARGESASDGILLAAGSSLNLAGETSLFDGVAAASPGGRLQLDAAGGDIRQESGALIDVSAGSGARAGAVAVSARNGAATFDGELRALSGDSVTSGVFEVEAARIEDLNALNRTLNRGGFGESRRFHQRGAGDLIVAQGAEQAIRAERVDVIADQGAVSVAGEIIARGASGGRVQLIARDDVRITGTIDARASAEDGDGGRVALMSSVGGVHLQAGSSIDVTAGAGAERQGRLDVRMERSRVFSLADADASNDALVLAGAVRGVGRTQLEAYAAYNISGELRLARARGRQQSVVRRSRSIHAECDAHPRRA